MSASERDGHAARAELALGLRIVGVVAVERGHVVGDRQAGLAGARAAGGSARWCPRPRRSRRTCASSTAACGSRLAWMPRVNGGSPGHADVAQPGRSRPTGRRPRAAGRPGGRPPSARRRRRRPPASRAGVYSRSISTSLMVLKRARRSLLTRPTLLRAQAWSTESRLPQNGVVGRVVAFDAPFVEVRLYDARLDHEVAVARDRARDPVDVRRLEQRDLAQRVAAELPKLSSVSRASRSDGSGRARPAAVRPAPSASSAQRLVVAALCRGGASLPAGLYRSPDSVELRGPNAVVVSKRAVTGRVGGGGGGPPVARLARRRRTSTSSARRVRGASAGPRPRRRSGRAGPGRAAGRRRR